MSHIKQLSLLLTVSLSLLVTSCTPFISAVQNTPPLPFPVCHKSVFISGRGIGPSYTIEGECLFQCDRDRKKWGTWHSFGPPPTRAQYCSVCRDIERCID